LAKRKWIPPYRRLMAASCAAAEKLAKVRVTVGRKSDPVLPDSNRECG
jgi:hypothetical protein